jgi:Protein of unknown function (DUF1682)
MRHLLVFLALFVFGILVGRCAVDDFDDDFEGSVTAPQGQATAAAPAAQPSHSKQQATAETSRGSIVGLRIVLNDNIALELLGLSALVIYGALFLVGRRANTARALAWAKEYASDGSILQRNFALVGSGKSAKKHQVLMKESESQFLVWASGRRCAAPVLRLLCESTLHADAQSITAKLCTSMHRWQQHDIVPLVRPLLRTDTRHLQLAAPLCRHCSGLMATLNLAARHDLMYSMYNLVDTKDDTVTVEVYMNPKTMPQTVLAVGLPNIVQHLSSSYSDLLKYAKLLKPESAGVKEWPVALVAVAESPAVFAGLFNKQIMDLAFSPQARASLLPLTCQGPTVACCHYFVDVARVSTTWQYNEASPSDTQHIGTVLGGCTH